MRFGTKEEIAALLRHNVCINGRTAHVVANDANFDWLVRELADDVEFGSKFDRSEIHCICMDEIGDRLDSAYVVYDSDGRVEANDVKVGSYAEVIAMLKQDVCLGGNKAHVIMNGLSFYLLLFELAADAGYGRDAFWRISHCLVRKSESFALHQAIGKKMAELRELIFEAAEEEACRCQGTTYVIHRDVRLALDEFGTMVKECNGDSVRAVDLFNKCFRDIRYFQNSGDKAPFGNVFYIDSAILNPVRIIGSLAAEKGPDSAFVSLVLQYLSISGNVALKLEFLCASGVVDDPRFEPTYELIYRAYHKYYCLGYQVCQLES